MIYNWRILLPFSGYTQQIDKKLNRAELPKSLNIYKNIVLLQLLFFNLL